MPTPPRRVSSVPRALFSAVVVSALITTACGSLSPEELADRYRAPDVANLRLEQSSEPDTATEPTVTTAPDSTPTGSPEGRAPRPEPLVADYGDCWFDPDPYSVDCGWIHIPSDSPGVDPVRISFARFNAERADAADPVVYLHGGPGGAVLELADLLAPSIVDPFIEGRDVIVYDQRGAGESSPLPLCREAWGLDTRFYAAGEPHADIEKAYFASLRRCAERVERRDDLDLADYNSAVHADDLLDLIRALGYPSVNLYGNSYGTRLAQTMLRDHPEPIRSVILSGVYPIEENLIGSVPETFRAALEQVFAACTADPACASHLPDPWSALDTAVGQLDVDPVEITVSTADLPAFDQTIAGDDLINLLHGLLYAADGAALIPDLLVDLGNGHTGRLRRIGPDAIYDTAGVLGFMAVECREEAPFTTPSQAAEAERLDTPWHRINLAPGLVGGLLLDGCPLFPSIGEAIELENDPVTWQQPTLILSGAFDPITPPWWADAMAARLPNATLASFADRGHDADEGVCAFELMSGFVIDPSAEPDLSCVTDDAVALTNTPEILVSPLDGSLRPSTFDVDPGAGSLVLDMRLPEWEVDIYATEEAYWRGLDAWDPTVIVVRSGSWAPEEVTWYIDGGDAYGFVEEAASAGVSSRWTRRILEGPGLDAVSYVIDEPDFAINISVVAMPHEIADLERAILVPIVNSVDLP